MNGQSPVSTSVFENLASYFKALAHPIRLQILVALRQSEACVCHLEALLGKRQAYISQQIGVLKQAGLLSDHRGVCKWWKNPHSVWCYRPGSTGTL